MARKITVRKKPADEEKSYRQLSRVDIRRKISIIKFKVQH